MGADGARRPQPTRPRAGRCPAELGAQHRLPLPARVGEHCPAQELRLGGPPSGGSVLLSAHTGGSVPHAGVPNPIPLPFHLFHDNVQWPTTQGGALLPGWRGRHLCPPGHFSVDQRRWEPGIGGHMSAAELTEDARGLLCFSLSQCLYSQTVVMWRLFQNWIFRISHRATLC